MRNASIAPLLFAALLAALPYIGCSSSSPAGRVADVVQHNIGISTAEVGTGVIVETRRAPIMPVSQPGVENSAPLGGAHIRVLRGENIIGDLVTNGEGRIGVELEPGTYTLQALPTSTSQWPSPPPPQTVQVRRNGEVGVTFVYDTGIR